MKLFENKKIKIYGLIPFLGEYKEDILSGGRTGTKLVLNTGFVYLKSNEDAPSWFEFRLLGFGFGFAWEFVEDFFDK